MLVPTDDVAILDGAQTFLPADDGDQDSFPTQKRGVNMSTNLERKDGEERD